MYSPCGSGWGGLGKPRLTWGSSSLSTALAGMMRDFSDATLVLIGHGSTVNAESSATVYLHAAELRRRGIFARVEEVFWKEAPLLAELKPGTLGPRVFFVPLLISEGYFTEEAIPAVLGFGEREGLVRVLRKGGQTLHYCRPIGTHPRMAEVLLARAREVVERFPFPRQPKPSDIALFVVGHGTPRNQQSREAIESVAERIRALDLYWEVQAVYIEEDPRVGDCYGMTSARNIVVAPFFMAEGMHTAEDIPILLGAPREAVRKRLQAGQPAWRNPTERNGKLVWYASSVGSDPGIAELILERVAEMAAGAAPDQGGGG